MSNSKKFAIFDLVEEKYVTGSTYGRPIYAPLGSCQLYQLRARAVLAMTNLDFRLPGHCYTVVVVPSCINNDYLF